MQHGAERHRDHLADAIEELDRARLGLAKKTELEHRERRPVETRRNERHLGRVVISGSRAHLEKAVRDVLHLDEPLPDGGLSDQAFPVDDPLRRAVLESVTGAESIAARLSDVKRADHRAHASGERVERAPAELFQRRLALDRLCQEYELLADPVLIFDDSARFTFAGERVAVRLRELRHLPAREERQRDAQADEQRNAHDSGRALRVLGVRGARRLQGLLGRE